VNACLARPARELVSVVLELVRLNIHIHPTSIRQHIRQHTCTRLLQDGTRTPNQHSIRQNTLIPELRTVETGAFGVNLHRIRQHMSAYTSAYQHCCTLRLELLAPIYTADGRVELIERLCRYVRLQTPAYVSNSHGAPRLCRHVRLHTPAYACTLAGS
jgi:hypothetical protein